jgi:hypothetical protein
MVNGGLAIRVEALTPCASRGIADSFCPPGLSAACR